MQSSLMFVRSIDPRTGTLIKETECSGLDDVTGALLRARAAQPRWQMLGAEGRIEIMRNVERSFQQEKERLADLIQSEGGYPRRDVMGAYVGALRGVEYYAERMLKGNESQFALDQTSWPNTTATIQLVPHGVIGHIGIWNYPFWQTMITAIPALIAGNAIVFKPSELTTLTGLRIAELLHQAGVPEDVFIPLVGGKEVGQAMVRADFDALVFTGSVRTGLDIMHHSGVKPLILELSGNDPAIVCSDADIEQCARGIANGTFSHGGQVCIRIKRVYVVKDVAERFLERFLSLVRSIDVREQVGPLIREEARENVHRMVREAIDKGAKLLHGGRYLEGPGYYYEPTVLLVELGQEVRFDEEIFGPVCPIIIVEDESEALSHANDSRYGLGATIWTSDVIKGNVMASHMEAGTIWINECGRTLTGGEYFQGWKDSGMASSQDRLSRFLKKRAIIHHCSSAPREHWMK